MTRQPAIDWARGVASLLMIQGHAWHAWVAPEVKLEAPYRLTRVVATLPLPAFLVLAGAGVAMRVRAASARGEAARDLRATLVLRGLQVMGAGYAASAVYAILDGADSLDTLLRADVLHVIGLCLITLGLLAGGGRAPQRSGVLAMRAAWAGVAVVVLCPLLANAWPHPPALLRPLVGLFIDVPGITQMPLVPLLAWAALGSVCGHWIGVTATAAEPAPSPHPRGGRLRIPRPVAVALALVAALGLVAAVVGQAIAAQLVAASGEPLSRAHLAVIPNAVEYGGRGMIVLGLSPLLVARLPRPAQEVVRQFGQASLYAYVFHIPFCYGRFGLPLQDRLTMSQAAPLIVVLTIMSYAVVRARLTWKKRRPQALNTAAGA